MNLTDEQIKHYNDQGYLVFPTLIQGEKLSHYKRVLDALVERAKTMTQSQNGFALQPDAESNPIPRRLFKVQGLCVVEPRLLDGVPGLP